MCVNTSEVPAITHNVTIPSLVQLTAFPDTQLVPYSVDEHACLLSGRKGCVNVVRKSVGYLGLGFLPGIVNTDNPTDSYSVILVFFTDNCRLM